MDVTAERTVDVTAERPAAATSITTIVYAKLASTISDNRCISNNVKVPANKWKNAAIMQVKLLLEKNQKLNPHFQGGRLKLVNSFQKGFCSTFLYMNKIMKVVHT